MAKKILIVEDEPDMVAMLKSRLEANQFEVLTALDGEEGLKKIEKDRPDLILLDVMMPKMDGYAFVLEFKKIADLKTTPIIVLTAKDKMEELFKIEGINEYIVKPFKDEDLLAKIKKFLG